MRITAGVAVVAGLVVAVASAGSPAGAAHAPQPDLVVTAAFDKASYVGGETATVTFRLRNAGSAPATNIHVTGGDGGGIDITTFATLGFDIAPGETRTADYIGTINQAGADTGATHWALEFGSDEDDANPEDNDAVARAVVTGETGALTVLAYHEVDGDLDTVDGDGVPGVHITLVNEISQARAAAGTTDARGEFRFLNVPTGPYQFDITLPPGWKLADFASAGAQVTTTSDVTTAIALIAVPVPPTTAPPGPGLPVTGSRTGLAAGLGAAVVLAGVVLILLGRRRRTPSIGHQD